jgi:hypothetical protein
MYLLSHLNSQCREVYEDMSSSRCNPYLAGLGCSNLVVESRDEILFKGG